MLDIGVSVEALRYQCHHDMPLTGNIHWKSKGLNRGQDFELTRWRVSHQHTAHAFCGSGGSSGATNRVGALFVCAFSKPGVILQ